MASLLSDDELRRKLKIHGVDVGPITPTTRRVYEKKLSTLQRKGTPTLNTLSSDDSEIDQVYSESSSSKTHRKKRYSQRTPPIQINFSDKEPKDVFKKPLPTTPRYSPRVSVLSGPTLDQLNLTSKTSKQNRRSYINQSERSSFDVEASDSDFESNALLNPMRTSKLHNRSNHYTKNDKGEYLNALKKARTSVLTSTPNGDDFKGRKNLGQKYIDWSFFQKRYNSLLSGLKYTKECNVNGYISEEFHDRKGTAKTTNYSHCVSWMLVLGTAAFFVGIGVFYMSAVQKTQMAASRSLLGLDSFVCKNENLSNCIPEKYLNPAVAATHELHNILSTVAGEYECNSGRNSRNLSLLDTKAALKVWFTATNADEVEESLSFDKIFEYAIFLSLKNPGWGIKILSSKEESLDDVPLDKLARVVSALESKHASKSLFCRLKHSIQWTMTRIMILILVVTLVCLSFVAVKLLKKRKELEEKEFYDLVERIIDLLQSEDLSSSGPSKVPSRAVVHLRDSLIPFKDRRAKQKLWDRAVAFIEANESRVQVDYERIGGEEFKVWRWLPNPTTSPEGGKQGKVWQGQAFGSLSKGKNYGLCSPTPCLKIRNMFDPEVEYGDDWQVCIKDAILEKCEGNYGIVHIAVDTSSSEGCIYMLCNSPAAAGKAYGALHGWWFDGKLVTVKYLRLERYLERYPSAEKCMEPLKPSNNKRLSLSAPFFSSALELS